MQEQEFKQQLKKEYRGEKSFYYIFSFIVCFFSSWGLYKVLVCYLDNLAGIDYSTTFFLIVLLPFSLLGPYSLWRIPLHYRIHAVNTFKSQNKNVELIKIVSKELSIEVVKKRENYFRCSYKGVFNISHTLFFIALPSKIQICFITEDNHNGGFIDFGYSKRKMKEIKKYIVCQSLNL